MKRVNVTTLRQHLPEYLARVERGETLGVTVRGRVIATIAPPAPERSAAEAARARLRGSVVRFEAPLEPVIAPQEWEMQR
jgi:prevent-host-death family protein